MSLSLVPAQTTWKATRNRKREDLWHAEGCVCHWCKKPTLFCDDPVWNQCTIEHIIPLSKGGSNQDDNLASSCRMCNSRRAYEDALGVADGSLLGKFPVTDRQKRAFGFPVSPQPKPKSPARVCLTADDKAALFKKTVVHKAEDVLREQRDQALKELALVRKENKFLHELVADQDKEMKGMTVWGLVKKRLAAWLLA